MCGLEPPVKAKVGLYGAAEVIRREIYADEGIIRKFEDIVRMGP